MPSTTPTIPMVTAAIPANMVDALTNPPRSAAAVIVEAFGVIVGARWPLRSFGRGGGLGDAELGGDARAQLGRRLLRALRHDHLPELELEGEPLGARRAVVEVAGDGPPLPHRQLAVEVFVDA